MSLLGFIKENAPAVESMVKRQTIRRTRKDIYPGKALQLYTGLRHKSCRKLVQPDPVCLMKDPIIICGCGRISLNGKQISWKQQCQLAKADGFACRADFIAFFEERYGLPFGTDGRGAEVIYW